MEAIDCEVVKKEELRAMARHMDKLRGQNYRLRRDRTVLFWMFIMTAMALAYLIGRVPAWEEGRRCRRRQRRDCGSTAAKP